jgi:DNA-binding transcriptional LysR family regulator
VQVLQEARHRGSCRFGVHVTFGETVLPSLLRRLAEQLPDITVRAFVTNTRENEEMLLRNELDFAVIDNVKGLEALRTVPLGKEEMAVVCRPDHRSGNSITLEELAGERLLLREKGSGTRDSIDTVFGAAGLTVSAFLDSSSTYALLSCAREGLGVTILPRSLTAEALREGTLKELTVTDGAFFRRYYLAHHKNKYLTDNVRQVVQALKDCCRESGILA